jgi:LysM repeat protein
MNDRPGPRERRDRNGGRSSTSGGSAYRRGSPTARQSHRHPVYGLQARRQGHFGMYVVGFIAVVAALAAFLYVGLNWATGPGRVASLAIQPTPTPIAMEPTAAPGPSPTVVEQVYIVKAGDTPAAIADQFRVKVDDLLAANNIDDPRKLQVGQSLKIPPSSGRTP